MANNKKQKLLIQDILSSPEIYTRTAGILKSSYFDQEYEPVVQYIHDYYDKYGSTPAIDQIDAEFDVQLEATTKVTRDRVEATCDEVEKFCKETAVKEAIYNSLDDIEKQEMSRVLARITEAVNISLQRDMGVDVFDNPEEQLKALIEEFTPIPTGIDGIDGPLDGGLIRKQFTLFSANSGGGKSVMLANIGANYALRGYNVLYISLELPAEMVFLRLASIISGYDTSNWKSHIPEMSAGIISAKNDAGEGSYMIKRLPQHSTSADIRSYLSFYEMEYGKLPDVLLIDYLDLMDPNAGPNNMGIFEQDKRKSEEVVEILHEYDMIGVSASQQNRDAIGMTTPNQSIIAGGISKINTVDNYISLYMDETMRLEGEMNAYFLKTRSSRGVGHCSILNFNGTNLRISNLNGDKSGVMPRKRKDKVSIENALEKLNEPKAPAFVKGLPGTHEDQEPEVIPMFDDDDEPPIMPKIKSTEEDLKEMQDLISDFSGV